MNSHLVELVLTCGSWQEAQRIADALLETQIVNSIETFDVKPKHWWDHQTHGTQEVKVLVLAPAENFQNIQSLVSKIHHTKTAPILLTELIK